MDRDCVIYMLGQKVMKNYEGNLLEKVCGN